MREREDRFGSKDVAACRIRASYGLMQRSEPPV